MDKLFSISLLVTILLSLIFSPVAAKQVTLELTVANSRVTGTVVSAQIGTEITVKCLYDDVLSRSDEPSIFYQREVGDEPEHVTTEHLQGRWNDAASYEASYDTDTENDRHIEFTIIHAKITDTGMYECRWTQKPNADESTIISRASVTLTILAPTTKVEILGLTDGKLATTDGSELDVLCKAFGGSPPTMTLTIGSNAPQTMSVAGAVNEGNATSPLVTYTGTVPRLVFTSSMNGLNAVCRAVVENLPEQQAVAVVFLKSGPKITCDQTEVKLNVETVQDVRITCTVTSNPLPTRDSIEWITQGLGNPVTLNSGNNFDGGYAGFSSTVTINQVDVQIILDVKVQEKTLPDPIKLFVSNGESSAQQDVVFTKAGPINGSTRTIAMGSALSLLLALLVAV